MSPYCENGYDPTFDIGPTDDPRWPEEEGDYVSARDHRERLLRRPPKTESSCKDGANCTVSYKVPWSIGKRACHGEVPVEADEQ